MTRKHYIAIADMLARRQPYVSNDPEEEDYSYGKMRGALSEWEGIRDDLCDLFKADNPNFDRQKFVEATERS